MDYRYGLVLDDGKKLWRVQVNMQIVNLHIRLALLLHN